MTSASLKGEIFSHAVSLCSPTSDQQLIRQLQYVALQYSSASLHASTGNCVLQHFHACHEDLCAWGCIRELALSLSKDM